MFKLKDRKRMNTVGKMGEFSVRAAGLATLLGWSLFQGTPETFHLPDKGQGFPPLPDSRSQPRPPSERSSEKVCFGPLKPGPLLEQGGYHSLGPFFELWLLAESHYMNQQQLSAFLLVVLSKPKRLPRSWKCKEAGPQPLGQGLLENSPCSHLCTTTLRDILPSSNATDPHLPQVMQHSTLLPCFVLSPSCLLAPSLLFSAIAPLLNYWSPCLRLCFQGIVNNKGRVPKCIQPRAVLQGCQ